ncbi:MAG TPA: aminotransferase class III-fold pyridoxal phosphate-dependent enzyme, partial [Actinomycetota bacterium]
DTLDVIEPLLDGHVDTVAGRLRDGLDSLRANIPDEGAEVRGHGLWLALELGGNGNGGDTANATVSAKEVARAALSRGLVVNPVTETALRIAPPLVIAEAEIDEGLARLGGALEEVGACR